MMKKMLFALLILNAPLLTKAQHFIPVVNGNNCEVRFLYTDTSNNILYLTGAFGSINGKYAREVASFDGVNFDSLHIGMDANASLCPGAAVASVCRFQNYLFAAGGFRTVDSISATGLAKWNGNAWDSVSGWLHYPQNPFYAAICFLNYNNELYIGGSFDTLLNNPNNGSLAKWNGTNLTSFSTNIRGNVLNFCIYDNKLFCSGNFWDSTGALRDIGYIDSTGTVHGIGFSGWNQNIITMVVYHNELYAGGFFTQSGGAAGNYIMKWDGTSWYDVGGGMDDQVECLAVYNDRLYVGGGFRTAGSVAANGIALWDGNSWNSLSVDSPVVVGSIAFYKNELYVAGVINGNYVAKFDGVLPNGINAISSFNFSLTPNPTTTNFAIHFSSPLKSSSFMLLTNTLGQTVASYSLNRGEIKKEEDISGLARGVYFVVLQTEEGRVVRKVVKE